VYAAFAALSDSKEFSGARNSLHVFPRLPPMRVVAHFLHDWFVLRFKDWL